MHISNKKTLLFCLLGLGISAAEASMSRFLPTSYIAGMDIQTRYLGFSEGQGKEVFPKEGNPYIQGNAFLGVKFSDYFGIEAGYSEAQSKTRHANNSDGVVLARPLDVAFGEVMITRDQARIASPYVDLIGFLPLNNYKSTQLFGMVGMAYPRVTLSHSPIGDESTPQYDQTTINSLKRNFVSIKPVLRLGVGIQHMVTSHIGFRATAHWENLSRFKNLAPTQPSNYRASLKDSISCGIGAFWQF